MIAALFEDHYEAFPLWREAGLRGLTCVHVDAHLDVMEEGFTPEVLDGIGKARRRDELAAFRGLPQLPWGGFHCGNYLYPALLDGTVTTLIWVLPPFVLKSVSLLDSVRQELATWVDLTFAEYRSLREIDGRVEGELLGRRLVVCTSGAMPPLTPDEQANLALDIDIDYFVRLSDDSVWQTPHQLSDHLGPLQPVALTVALSCDGGYTPNSERYLGQVCMEVFSGEARHRSEMEAMLGQDWEALLETVPAAWKPAVLCHLGRAGEASMLDPDYSQRPLNQAARCLQKGDVDEGLAILSTCDDPDGARQFLLAFLGAGRGDSSVTERQMRTMLARPDLGDFERAQLWRKQAELCAGQGLGRAAINALKNALKAEPGRADTHFRLAVHLRRSGQRDAAARSLRTALKLVEGRISSLPMLHEAWQLYEDMGQPALARAARKELENNDVIGVYAADMLLERGRGRRLSS